MVKKAALALSLFLMLITTAVSASPVEKALTDRSDETVYFVMKLEDTANFLKWAVSDDNVNPFMPLITASKNSGDIISGLELTKMFAEVTPLKSAAVIFGMNPPDKEMKKSDEPFVQIAFTVEDELKSVVNKVADGTAVDSDFVSLILGDSNPLSMMASTMIKAEKLNDNIYRVDTGIFVKAEDGVVFLAETLDDLKSMNKDGQRLFVDRVQRKFSDGDFVFAHVDYGTIDALDEKHALDDADEIATKYFGKPLELEFSFKSVPEKFVISMFVNLQEAIKKEYYDEKSASAIPVKGSYIKPSGEKTPLLAFGGSIHLSTLRDQAETKKLWSTLVKTAKLAGLSEDDIVSCFDGALSFTVNDSVNFEVMKIPGVYVSQTGKAGTASSIFEKLAKTKFFHKVQDGVLQADTSISPVSCLVNVEGDALRISFSELSTMSSKPIVKPLLEELLNTEGIAALWLDFEAARSWVMDADNGVFAMLLPMSKMMGFSEVVEAAQDVLSAELSVPSFSMMAENTGTFRFEFENAKINPENGLITKLVKQYLKFKK